ncbi:MAG: heparan-alpha-glucosaminide N-acetyltransferase domain-containing protein, partial [Planctomycetota bacterium]|nr:heparan-alpha-glucosaminide N-acetyltransferase domain-containing protein [Planctomycetota bacterium]
MTQPQTISQRLVSLDALRGFDMLIILGIDDLSWRIREAAPGPITNFVSDQLSHAEWVGFRFLDLIFPLFVFLSGASAAFSVTRGIESLGKAGTVRRLFTRFAVLYLLGLLYYGGLSEGLDQIRWVGVLQRIAAASLATGLLLCFARSSIRLMIAAGILAAYWALLCFVPIPGGTAGDFGQGPTHNWTNWIDFHYLLGLKWDKTHDPEGLLSTLPAIATCILGSSCGEWLKRRDVTPSAKVLGLLAAGVALTAAGWLWGMQFPVIKKLWTSSYVLVAGGYSCLLLAA